MRPPFSTLGLLLLDGLLLWAGNGGKGASTPSWLHPLAPPLTRIASLGDCPLGAPAPPRPSLDARFHALASIGTHLVDRRLEEPIEVARGLLQRYHELEGRELRLRLDLSRASADLCALLDPALVDAAALWRDRLGDRLAEGWAWREAARELEPGGAEAGP